MMPTPGAKRSTQAPKFEKAGLASAESTAPTVIAFGTRAGEKPQASDPSLPAAVTTGMPAAIARFTAWSMKPTGGPPRLMLMIDRPGT